MALVWIMIPGLGFFYSGLLRRKNALSMIYLSMMTVAVVSFEVYDPTLYLCISLNGPSSGFSGDSLWRLAKLVQNSLVIFVSIILLFISCAKIIQTRII